tara:strand:- start:335 stop:961 length:627 start_codon:yes stop_codon:yes gene_type:complete
MNLVKNLEQRTEEWKQIRKGSIGGTRVKMVMAKNNLPLIDELIAEKHTDLIEENYINDAMQRGIDLEPFAIKEFEELSETKVDTFGLVTNEKFPGCHLSPDGLVLDVTGVPMFGVEVKCPSTKKHVEYIRTNRVPAEYKYQVYHYFTICDTISSMFFVSYDPRFEARPVHMVQLNREDITEELEAFKTGLLKFIDKLNKNELLILDTF